MDYTLPFFTDILAKYAETMSDSHLQEAVTSLEKVICLWRYIFATRRRSLIFLIYRYMLNSFAHHIVRPENVTMLPAKRSHICVRYAVAYLPCVAEVCDVLFERVFLGLTDCISQSLLAS